MNPLHGLVDGKVLFIVIIEKVLSFPYVRDFIKSEMCNVIFEKFGEADMLAGVATAEYSMGGYGC